MQETLNKLISGELKGCTRLKLSCNLNKFPSEIYSLADTLELLDLSANNFSELPEDFFRFQKLKILFLSENNFTTFPKVLSKCLNLEMIGFKTNKISNIDEDSFPPKLRWLILTNNKLKTLPKSIGKCNRLQKLMLAGNYLEVLPAELGLCTDLELLRISANRIKELPSLLFSLPKLAWLAFAGNELLPIDFIHSSISEYPLENFKLGKKLGEGASGNIYEADWVNSDKPKVAIKIFKGEVTSDGFPSDEISVSLQADVHPNLVTIIGKIKDSIEEKQGLVYELISDSYKKLGNPPDFETCTRDTFPTKITFSIEQILRILVSISSAMLNLHKQGITHGDLYAHNILVEETNFHTILGDFGAASFYNRNFSQALAIELIEVRAFGCLMDDLIVRISKEDKVHEEFHHLEVLRDECMSPNITYRPSFINIFNKISKLIYRFTENCNSSN